jgi:hypothetical protein
MSMSTITDFAQQLQNSGIFKGPVEILSAANELVDEHAVVKFSLKAEARAAIPPVPGAPAGPVKSNTITSAPAAAPAGGPSSGSGE